MPRHRASRRQRASGNAPAGSRVARSVGQAMPTAPSDCGTWSSNEPRRRRIEEPKQRHVLSGRPRNYRVQRENAGRRTGKLIAGAWVGTRALDLVCFAGGGSRPRNASQRRTQPGRPGPDNPARSEQRARRIARQELVNRQARLDLLIRRERLRCSCFGLNSSMTATQTVSDGHTIRDASQLSSCHDIACLRRGRHEAYC